MPSADAFPSAPASGRRRRPCPYRVFRLRPAPPAAGPRLHV